MPKCMTGNLPSPDSVIQKLLVSALFCFNIIARARSQLDLKGSPAGCTMADPSSISPMGHESFAMVTYTLPFRSHPVTILPCSSFI